MQLPIENRLQKGLNSYHSKLKPVKAFQPRQISLRVKVSGSFLWFASFVWNLLNCLLTIKIIKLRSSTYIAKVLCSPWDSSNQLWKDKRSTVNWFYNMSCACNMYPTPLKTSLIHMSNLLGFSDLYQKDLYTTSSHYFIRL